MPSHRTPSLSTLYQQARCNASATGRDQHCDLSNGGRFAVRVRDGVITLTVQRRKQPVGATEISTFLAHCQVPATATRIPSEGQKTRTDSAGQLWHYVAWRWRIANEGGEIRREPRPPRPAPKPSAKVQHVEQLQIGLE